jgi:hypothetical protein
MCRDEFGYLVRSMEDLAGYARPHHAIVGVEAP